MSLNVVPVNWRSLEEAVRLLANAVNGIADGRSNAVGTMTLTASTTTTQISDRRVGTDSVISFMPTTANAAAEIGAGGMYVSEVTQGSFTVTHANNGQTDRDFSYAITG